MCGSETCLHPNALTFNFTFLANDAGSSVSGAGKLIMDVSDHHGSEDEDAGAHLLFTVLLFVLICMLAALLIVLRRVALIVLIVP